MSSSFEVYARIYPEYAKYARVLTEHGWTQTAANVWKRKIGKKSATISVQNSGLQGKGDLALLNDGYTLLFANGLIV